MLKTTKFILENESSIRWIWSFSISLYTNVESREIIIGAGAQQNQHNQLCTQWRLRSAWASAQSDQSLRYVLYG